VREEGNDHGRAGRVYYDCSQRFVFVVHHDQRERDRRRAGRLVVFVVHDDCAGRLVLVGCGRYVEQQRRRHGRVFVVQRPVVERRFGCVFQQPERQQLFVEQQVIAKNSGRRVERAGPLFFVRPHDQSARARALRPARARAPSRR
jgi:hypothetical protein